MLENLQNPKIKRKLLKWYNRNYKTIIRIDTASILILLILKLFIKGITWDHVFFVVQFHWFIIGAVYTWFRPSPLKNKAS